MTAAAASGQYAYALCPAAVATFHSSWQPPTAPPAWPACLPAALAGYAYVGGTRSIFQGVYPRDPSALLHEMGHSLGLWHASVIPSERPMGGTRPAAAWHLAHHRMHLLCRSVNHACASGWAASQGRHFEQQLLNEA